MGRPVIVLDTSALLFRTLQPDRLSSAAQLAIQQQETLAVSSISIWEIGLEARQGKLVLPLPTSHYVRQLEGLAGLKIMPVDTRTWLATIDLDWPHRGPADRTIVATAMMNSCPLVTSDQTIQQVYQASVW